MDQALSLREQLEEANETIRQLREAMRPAAPYIGLSLSPAEEAILAMLLTSSVPCGSARINTRVGIVLNRVSASNRVVAVQVCRLRKKLAVLDPPVKISSFPLRPGYWMEPSDKERLLARRA